MVKINKKNLVITHLDPMCAKSFLKNGIVSFDYLSDNKHFLVELIYLLLKKESCFSRSWFDNCVVWCDDTHQYTLRLTKNDIFILKKENNEERKYYRIDFSPQTLID